MDDALILAVARDYRTAPVDPKTMALLDFAFKLSREPSRVTRFDWNLLLEAGWTEPQIVEAVHIVGLFEYANRVAEGFGMTSQGHAAPMLLEFLHQRPGGAADPDVRSPERKAAGGRAGNQPHDG